MPPDPRVHCGVAVYIERYVMTDGGGCEVLLVERAGSGEYASDGHGTWAMPGGWVDFGESLTDTAVRECAEEMGCEVEAGEVIDVVSVMSENNEFQIVVPVLRGFIVGGRPQVMEPDKHSAVEWVSMASLKDLPLFGSTRIVFGKMGLV